MTGDGRRFARSTTLGIALLLAACGGSSRTGATRAASFSDQGALRATGEGRPPLAVVAREGDARGAVAAAVTTEGIAPERGALPAVALAALVEARLNARGLADANALGGWGGLRLRALAGSSAEAVRTVEGIREAMLAPVVQGEPALEVVARKVAR